jgi:biotin carboxylase
VTQDAKTLHGISELRGFFRTNETPVYFVSPIAFNLLGIDRWVRRFHYVNYFDSFDGGHPCVFVPARTPHAQFGSIEDVCNYLLAHPALSEFVSTDGLGARSASRGKAVFVFFDAETERRAADVGLDVALPSAELRHRLDSKIVTTRLGEEAGVPSVPNVLGRAKSYAELTTLATEAGLGEDLVVQTPYGDSGKTTFFVRGERDWNADAGEMADQELKVMRRIDPRAVAVEACITRHGTVIGPLMTDLTGHPELTPYRGGWCGNDIFPGALSPANRERAIEFTRKLGDRLAGEGYRGQLEVDYLVDAANDKLYLGELNPRLSGISSMTNVSASAYADMPLFLFHLAEYLDLDYEIDVEDLRRRWGRDHETDIWGQIILKEPDDGVELLTDAPRTGVWRLDRTGQMSFGRPAADWHGLRDESEGFFLRILGPGDYRYRGADLGTLVTRARLQGDDGRLTERCRAWISAIRSRFAGAPLEPHQEPPIKDALAFKTG